MECGSCGRMIMEDAKFCPYCGQALIKEAEERHKKVCPNCKKEFEEDKVFCDFCGFKLVEKSPAADSQLVAENVNTNIAGEGHKELALCVINMMSKYIGEPNVGIAKATGKLSIYRDCIQYEKVMGNSLGYATGLIGMISSQQKLKKEGKLEVYPMDSISSVYKGKYMYTIPMLVLKMKDGTVLSFAGTVNGAKVDTAVDIIKTYI